MFGEIETNEFNYPIVYPTEISMKIFAGGDKPLDTLEIKDELHQYPVYANGEKNNGLVGYSSDYKVDMIAVTISGRGTIGYSVYRYEKFTPIVRLITLIPNGKINPIYLTYYLNKEREIGSGSGVAQLTVPAFKKKRILLPPLEKQNVFAELVEQIDKSKFVY